MRIHVDTENGLLADKFGKYAPEEESARRIPRKVVPHSD